MLFAYLKMYLEINFLYLNLVRRLLLVKILGKIHLLIIQLILNNLFKRFEMTKKILKGTYCLIIHLRKDTSIEVGKRGLINFSKGYYVYVGSALNSLESR